MQEFATAKYIVLFCSLRESLSAVRKRVNPPISRRAQIMCIFVCSPLYGESGQHGLSNADAPKAKATTTARDTSRRLAAIFAVVS